MTTFEPAGNAMLQMQDGTRTLAQALAALFSRHGDTPRTGFTGATFLAQEPGLASEAKLPEYMRII